MKYILEDFCWIANSYKNAVSVHLVTFQIPSKLLRGFHLNSCSTPKEVNLPGISLKRNVKTDLRTVFFYFPLPFILQ